MKYASYLSIKGESSIIIFMYGHYQFVSIKVNLIHKKYIDG